MRIANAIAELRRPPSISSFEPRQETHTPSSMVHHSTTIHQRTLSLTQSHHSFPGTPVYAQTHSGHSSMGSPIGYSVSSNGPLMPHPEVGRTDGLPTSATSASFGLGIAVPESANGKAAVRIFFPCELFRGSDIRLSGVDQASLCCRRAPHRSRKRSSSRLPRSLHPMKTVLT